MVTITFEDVVCERPSEKSEKYRLILFANEERQMKSVYRSGTNVFKWKRPFGETVSTAVSDSPLRISIELRAKGFIGFSGHTVALYSLEVPRDCQSATSNLRLIRSDILSPPDISVTISVAGLATVPAQRQNANERPNPDAVLPALVLPSGPTSSNTPDLGSLEAPTSVPVLAAPPTVQISSAEDPHPEPPIPSSDLSGPGIPGELSTEQESTAAHSPPNRGTAGSNDGLLAVAQNALDEASRDQSSIHSRPSSVLDLSSDAVPPGADAFGQAMWSGVSRLDAVVRIVAIAADIHPLVKGAWSLLNVAYTLAKDERELDLKIEDLVHALDTNCEFARVLAENRLEGAAASIVANILREVLKGASLIKEYCATRRSSFSVFRFAGSTTSARVDACLATFEVFRRDLSEHITAGVHRDLHGLQQIASTLNADLKAVKAQMDRIDKYVQTQEDEALLNQMPFAPDADRAMRSDERGCLPGTRAEIIEAIVHWAIGADVGPSQAYIRGLNPDSRVLWLCGVAGSGKSSIAISVARVLRSMERLGAIYGFESAFQTSLNPTNLFSTIARQRAEQQSGRKRHLLTTLNSMTRDQRATVSASEQFKSFLSTPSIDNPSILDDVVVIDAFDESAPALKRAAALLALSPETHNATFPSDVRFIITSRYDLDVARRLESVSKDGQPLVSVLQMEDIYPPDTERDIRTYIFYMLGNTPGLEAAQAAGDLARLAVTAEHSFQWASSASRYITDIDDHDGTRLPAERLHETLEIRGGLDELYLSILNQSFQLGVTRESDGTRSLRVILGCLVCASEPLPVQSIAALASADSSIQTVDGAGFHMLARKLSAIITGTKDVTTPLVAFHTSFTDFLADNKRSEHYAVDTSETHLHLALASLATMKKSLRFNICCLETSFLRNDAVPDLAERIRKHIPDELSYACRFWPVHVAAALSSTTANAKALPDSFYAFLESKPLLLQWLEVMSLTGTNAYESLGPLLSLQAGNRDLSDLITFTTYFSIPIGTSVPHIYLSALAFAPTSSLIITPVSTHFPNLVHSSPHLTSWPQIRHTFAHPSEVKCVAFSPNGRWVVSGANSGEISVWDVYSGNTILPRMSASGAIWSTAISRDGSLLASGSDDGTIQLWDMRTLSAVGEPVKAHINGVWSVTFSPNGMLLASGSLDNTICLWDLQSGLAEQRASATHDNSILSVAFLPDGKLLASGSEGMVMLWDVPALSPTGEPLSGHTDWVTSVVFSPDGALLVSGSGDGMIRCWDPDAQSVIGEPLTAHDSYIHSVVFSPDGKTLASCSDDKTVRLWNVQDHSLVGKPLTGHTGPVVSIAFSPDGSLLASGSSDKTVHIWDARVLALNRESAATQFKIQNFAAFSRDGMLLASGSDNYAIQLWDVHSMTTIGDPFKGHTEFINCVAFSPDGTLFASGSNDHIVRLWDMRAAFAAGEPFEGHQDWVRAVAFSPDGKLLASGSDDGTVRLWDTHARSAAGDPLEGHSGYVLSVAFSPDGSTLASGDAGGSVRLWDVQTRSLIGQALKGHSGAVLCVAFSPGGLLLASGFDDRTVCLWDVGTQSFVGEPLTGHTNWVTSLAFSPHGALLASCSKYENVIRVWDVRTPSEVGDPVALLRHKSNLFSIAFLSTTPILSSITSGGVVCKWDLQYLLSIQNPKVYSPEGHPKNHSTLLLPDHPNLSSLPPDFLEVLDDGWVVGPKKELVLWIPPAMRPSLSNLLQIKRFSGAPPTFLDFTNFVCGSDWTKCYSPPASSSPNL